MKKEVTVSLDLDILKSIDELCKKNFGVKRSTFINSILKEYLSKKKRGKKNGS